MPSAIGELTRRVHDTFTAEIPDGSLAGSCAEASALLAVLLADAGVDSEVVYGRYTVAWKRDHATGETISGDMAHFWVRLADTTICDPTRGQFYPRSIASRKPLVICAGHDDQRLYAADVTQGQTLVARPTREDCWRTAERCDASAGPYRDEGILPAITRKLIGPRPARLRA